MREFTRRGSGFVILRQSQPLCPQAIEARLASLLAPRAALSRSHRDHEATAPPLGHPLRPSNVAKQPPPVAKTPYSATGLKTIYKGTRRDLSPRCLLAGPSEDRTILAC